MNQKVDRRQFIITTGTVLTMPMLFKSFSYGSQIGDDFPVTIPPEDLDTPILKSIFYGITAPNSHNTQAWKFKIQGDTEMLLFVDENRILHETDPLARQMHISHGTFIEILTIGASSLGFRTEVSLFPEGEYELPEVGKKPVAHIRLVPDSTVKTNVLFSEIHRRITNKLNYWGDYISKEEFEKLKSLIVVGPIEYSFYNKPEEMRPLLDLFYRGMEIETNTYRTYDETKDWFRFSDEEIHTKRDGLSLEGIGITGIVLWYAKMTLSPDNWHNKFNRNTGLSGYKKKIKSSKGLIFMKTKTNTMKDWVKIGREYARLNLAVTKLGLSIHPMNQVNEEYDEMTPVREEFEALVGLKEGEKVQMIARLGRADESFKSLRRDVEDMIME